ncbi:hypothetical protein [Cupriavidus campinensis]
MLRLMIVTALAVCATNAQAVKCESGKKTLYTDAQTCPAGYSFSTKYGTGTVSSIGKSERVRQQENEFLRRREAENSQYQTQAAQTQAQAAQQIANNAGLCTSLSDQARSLESAMRQPNSAQTLDYLKQQHRTVRDQMYRNKC